MSQITLHIPPCLLTLLGAVGPMFVIPVMGGFAWFVERGSATHFVNAFQVVIAPFLVVAC